MSGVEWGEMGEGEGWNKGTVRTGRIPDRMESCGSQARKPVPHESSQARAPALHDATQFSGQAAQASQLGCLQGLVRSPGQQV
jgi:hypothetical protein